MEVAFGLIYFDQVHETDVPMPSFERIGYGYLPTLGPKAPPVPSTTPQIDCDRALRLSLSLSLPLSFSPGLARVNSSMGHS